MSGRVAAIIAVLAPELDSSARSRVAMISVQIVKALMPAIVDASEEEREVIVGELKRALYGYLAPVAPGVATS